MEIRTRRRREGLKRWGSGGVLYERGRESELLGTLWYGVSFGVGR